MIVDDPMLLEKEDEPIGLLVVRSKQVFVCNIIETSTAGSRRDV
jgi:hypothetical protein